VTGNKSPIIDHRFTCLTMNSTSTTSITAASSNDVYGKGPVKFTYLSGRVPLLLLPNYIEYNNDNEQIYIIPLSPPVNCRDVSVSRLLTETEPDLINNTTIQISFGSYSTTVTSNHRVAPAFNRGSAKPSGIYFTSSVDSMGIQKVKDFTLLLLNSDYCLETIPQSIVDDFDAYDHENTSNHDEALVIFFDILGHAYKSFTSGLAYEKLSKACDVFLNQYVATENHGLLPTNFNQILPNIASEATRKFQLCMHPMMCVIHNGMHRHMRVYLETHGLVAKDYDCSISGFHLRSGAPKSHNSETEIPTMCYMAYSTGIVDSDRLSTEQLQRVSLKENAVIEFTVKKETCIE
jgi:hypothetical protein